MKLLALRCPNCAEPLKLDNDAIVIACHSCFKPVAIAANGPQLMKIWFATMDPDQKQVDKWVPFWVYEGRVNILQRETQSGWRSNDEDAGRFWDSTRQLFIPAWDLDLHRAQDIGSRMIVNQPQFNFVAQPTKYELVEAAVKPDDAERLLEFIVLAIEARRKDWLKNLEFKIDVGKPQLWAMPASSFR